MLDFLRNLTKSAEEKRQEQLHAYVSDSLSERERRQFEALLEADADLRAEADALRQLRRQMRQMPLRSVPRSFTLDPALYGKPARQPLFQLYPAMRAATVLTAVFLMIAIAADFATLGGRNAADVAMAPAALESSAEVADEAILVEEESAELYAADATEAAVEIMATMAPEMEADTAEEAAEAAPMAAEPMEEMAADEAAAGDAEATATPSPTPTPLTPRLSPTEALENRSANATDDEAIVNETAVARVAPSPELESSAEDVVGLSEPADGTLETDVQDAPARTFAPSPLRVAQLGLGIILIGLLVLLQYMRMQL